MAYELSLAQVFLPKPLICAHLSPGRKYRIERRCDPTGFTVGRFLRIDCFHAPAGLFEADDDLLEGDQPADFRVLAALNRHLFLLAPRPVTNQQVVYLAGWLSASKLILSNNCNCSAWNYSSFACRKEEPGSG